MIKKEIKNGVYPYNVVKPIDLGNLPEVRGYDFEKGFDFLEFMDAYKSTALQASSLGRAVDIARRMVDDKAFIFLSFTSNIISSGLRDIIKFLVKNKHVHFIVTSAGGIEEDIIKCLNPFHVGVFEMQGKVLFDRGVARIGNIFVPVDRYAYFEKFMSGVFPVLLGMQKKFGRPLCTSEIAKVLGEKIGSEDSFLYWAWKNDIPVICPAIMDGSFGDLAYFFKRNNPQFAIDSTEDTNVIQRSVQAAETAGIIALGGGVPKHYILNANIFRDGVDYAVYLTTAQEYDGSDSGGSTEEAITWAKIKPDAMHVKVNADASITFPLLVAAAFANKKKMQKNKKPGSIE